MVTAGSAAYDTVEMRAVGIGDEYLTEIAGCDEVHDPLNAGGIKFVENIVKE